MQSLQRGLLALLLAATYGSAQADIATFTDKASFLAQTTATDASGPLPNVGLIAGGAAASLTVGSVTITLGPGASQLFSGVSGSEGVVGNDWSVRLPGAELAISGPENLNVAMSSAVFSFGYDIVEPLLDPNLNAPFVDSVFQVTLILGGSTVASFTFNPANDTAAFIGVWSDSPFDHVQIRETTALSGGENEFYGHFYTGHVAMPIAETPAIPEPGTYALLLGGLGLLALRRRRR